MTDQIRKGLRHHPIALSRKVLDKAKERVEDYFGYDEKRDEADYYVHLFEIPEKRGTATPENAFLHAYVSAALAYEWNEYMGRNLGEAREIESFWSDNVPEFLASGGDLAQLSRRIRDIHRDRYNNEIGFQIGEFAKANGIPYEDLPHLVANALGRGTLITDEMNDPRNGLLGHSAPEEWQPPNDTLQRGF
jgi:hypothetical protein